MLGRRLVLSDQAVGVLFIVPFVLTALFFMVYPIAEAVRMAFYSYNPLRPDRSFFVGLANFEYIFADPLFWKFVLAGDRLDRLLNLLPDRARSADCTSAAPTAGGISQCFAACCCFPTSCRRW